MAKERDGLAFRNPVKRKGWAQVYHVLTMDEELSDGAFRLYVLLLKYAQQRGGCWPGRERLARDLGTTTRTIDRRITDPAGAGWENARAGFINPAPESTHRRITDPARAGWEK